MTRKSDDTRNHRPGRYERALDRWGQQLQPQRAQAEPTSLGMDCIPYGGWDIQADPPGFLGTWGITASHGFFDLFCSPNSFEAARMGEVPTSCSSKEPILAAAVEPGRRLKMILRIASIYRRPQKVLEKDQMNIVEIHLKIFL